MKTKWLIFSVLAAIAAIAGSLGGGHAASSKGTVMTGKIVKSDAEWQKELSPEAYRILRHGGTEIAFTGKYWNNHEKGTYVCAADGNPLFSSETKFDSGTGWPSFFEPISKEAVAEKEDKSWFTTRTEVLCARCDAHLGHVFEDGPRPTGLRYCMNSVAMKHAPEGQSLPLVTK